MTAVRAQFCIRHSPRATNKPNAASTAVARRTCQALPPLLGLGFSLSGDALFGEHDPHASLQVAQGLERPVLGRYSEQPPQHEDTQRYDEQKNGDDRHKKWTPAARRQRIRRGSVLVHAHNSPVTDDLLPVALPSAMR
jgi:hypothetical protein